MKSFEGRTPDHAIRPLFVKRWSPRAFSPVPMPAEDLARIFEAARWAPSSYNSQPWRFLYAHRDTPHWAVFLGLLGDFNKTWAVNASVLIVAVSKATMRPPGQDTDLPNYSHSFDTGAAWCNMALQATSMGWHAHGMVGFDIPRAAVELHVPEGHRVEAAIAIGKLGDKSTLPAPLQARETPNGRDPISSFAFEGGFAT